jgi:hypothetical protein
MEPAKKRYYKLEDIGFVGTQENRSKAQVKRDIEQMVLFVKARKAGKVVPLSSNAKLPKAK